MILRRLHLRRFLGLQDAAFEFARGINIIVGPNEAGKSTLRAAIRTALYSNAATTSALKRDEFTSWGAEEPPELVLEFEVNGRIFTLTKDFARRAVLLADGTGRTWEQHKVVQERLGAVVGLPTEDLFVATAQVAHAELERIHVESVAKELGRLISGGGEDVAVAIRRLDQRVRAMEKGSKGVAIKEPGVLRALADRVASLQTECRRLTASVAEAERARMLRDKTAEVRNRLADEWESKRTLLELNRGILHDEDRLQALKREESMLDERVKNINENLGKLDAIDHDLEMTTATGVPDEDTVTFIRTQQGRMTALETQIQRLQSLLQGAPPKMNPVVRAWLVALIATGGLVGTAGVLLTILTQITAGLILFVAGIGGVLVGWWSLSVAAANRRLWRVRKEQRQQDLVILEGELADARADLADRLAQVGAASAKEVEDRFTRYRELVRDRAQVAAFISELRGGSSDEAIAERWKTVRRDIFAIEERLRAPEIADKRLTPLQVQALEREVDRLAQEVPQLEEREHRYSWELDRLTADAEALPVVEEQVQEAEEAIVAARHRHAVYRAGLDGLEEARRLAEVPARKVMEDRACEYLRILSDNRYARLQVEEESLGLRVWSDAAGDWVPVVEPHLSRGTVDLVYLSARLALVEVLAGDKRPPLLFDDPFITFDDRRRAAAAHLLKVLGETYQIFLFTCSRDYERYANRLIDLSVVYTEHAQVLPPRPAVPSMGPLWDRPL